MGDLSNRTSLRNRGSVVNTSADLEPLMSNNLQLLGPLEDPTDLSKESINRLSEDGSNSDTQPLGNPEQKDDLQTINPKPATLLQRLKKLLSI